MTHLNIIEIEARAEGMRESLGGTIFSFPVEPNNPFSEYAVTVFTGEGYKTFPNSLNIHDAAGGIVQILEGLKKSGIDADYGRNVRLTSYQAQINAPDVTMRKLRNTPGSYSTYKPIYESGVDIFDRVDELDGAYISARGLLKMTYIEMIEEKNPKAIKFMDEYYKLLAMKEYGKTAAAIKQEVRRMNKDEATAWIERTYKRYITDDMDVFNIMKGLLGETI